jgi:hypothetical protein
VPSTERDLTEVAVADNPERDGAAPLRRRNVVPTPLLRSASPEPERKADGRAGRDAVGRQGLVGRRELTPVVREAGLDRGDTRAVRDVVEECRGRVGLWASGKCLVSHGGRYAVQRTHRTIGSVPRGISQRRAWW